MNELKPAARAALEAMDGADGPTFEDRERLRRRIFGTIAAGGATAASSAAFGATSAAAGGAVGATLKSALFGSKLGMLGPAAFGLVVGGLVGSAVVISSELVVERASPAPSAAVSAARAHERNAIGTRASAVARGEREVSAVSPPVIADDPPGAQSEDGAPASSRRIERDVRTGVRERATGAAVPEGRDEAVAAVAAATASAPGIRDELALIEQAHRELSQGNATASLAVLDEHARRFPNGAFTAERAAARVFAFCALGQVEQARAVGDEFLRRAPASPLVPRIRSSCAGER